MKKQITSICLPAVVFASLLLLTACEQKPKEPTGSSNTLTDYVRVPKSKANIAAKKVERHNRQMAEQLEGMDNE